MGLAYLTRYDAVACIAAAGLLVGVTTYLRARPAPRFRRALLDLLMVSGPGFAAFIGWAAVSWLITGQAFAQFTSQYGNTAILEQSGQTKPDFGAGLVFAAACISLLAPTLVPIAVWGTVRRWRRPNWQLLLVPVTMYGAALAFQAYSYASGSTFPFLRFYIIAIPLTACLAMLAVPEGQLIATTRRGNYAPPQQPPDIVRRRRAAYLPVAAASRSRCLSPRGGWASPSMRGRNTRLGAVSGTGSGQRQCAEGPRTPHRRHLLHRAGNRTLSREARPSGELGDHRHRLWLCYFAASRNPEDVCGAIGSGFHHLTQRSRGERNQVPACRASVWSRESDALNFAIRLCTRPEQTLRRWNWRFPMTVTASRTGGCTG